MRPIYRLIAAAALALAALIHYSGDFSPETFALAPEVKLSTESWKGQYFTAPTIDLIKKVVASHAVAPAPSADCRPANLLWLGNSQLHFINQAVKGDHVAPYWLRESLACADTVAPLGMSLPNGNLQEHYVLAGYVAARLPVRMIILELCFDDMREDGLRAEFSGLVTDADSARMKKNPLGREIITRAEGEWHTTDTGEGASGESASGENAGLTGFVQKDVEEKFDAGLGKIWPLWANRANMRSQLLTDLYYLRNYLLGIKATTVRKVIGARYTRNMGALAQILTDAQAQGIPVLAYIAPIRHDIALPYDAEQYAAWKGEVAVLAKRTGATFVNLEDLVPNNQWGSYLTDDVDFMHFRGPGHKLLAKAVLPYVQAQLNGAR